MPVVDFIQFFYFGELSVFMCWPVVISKSLEWQLIFHYSLQMVLTIDQCYGGKFHKVALACCWIQSKLQTYYLSSKSNEVVEIH